MFWAGSRPSPLAGTNSTHRRWLAPGSGTLDWNNVDRALLDTDADAVFQLVTCLVLLSCRARCVAGDATVDVHVFPTVTSRTRGEIVHILLAAVASTPVSRPPHSDDGLSINLRMPVPAPE